MYVGRLIDASRWSSVPRRGMVSHGIARHDIARHRINPVARRVPDPPCAMLSSVPQLATELPSLHPAHGACDLTGSLPGGSTAV